MLTYFRPCFWIMVGNHEQTESEWWTKKPSLCPEYKKFTAMEKATLVHRAGSSRLLVNIKCTVKTTKQIPLWRGSKPRHAASALTTCANIEWHSSTNQRHQNSKLMNQSRQKTVSWKQMQPLILWLKQQSWRNFRLLVVQGGVNYLNGATYTMANSG